MHRSPFFERRSSKNIAPSADPLYQFLIVRINDDFACDQVSSRFKLLNYL